MANYRDIGIADATFTADVDLTQKQYYFVACASTAGNVGVATGTCAPVPLGILQNSPSLGQEAQVRVLGFSKLVCEVDASGCNLAWRNFVYCASDGQGQGACITGCPVNAWFMDSGFTSGSAIKQVLLIPLSASYAAAS